jgi:hypothetical protein
MPTRADGCPGWFGGRMEGRRSIRSAGRKTIRSIRSRSGWRSVRSARSGRSIRIGSGWKTVRSGRSGGSRDSIRRPVAVTSRQEIEKRGAGDADLSKMISSKKRSSLSLKRLRTDRRTDISNFINRVMMRTDFVPVHSQYTACSMFALISGSADLLGPPGPFSWSGPRSAVTC